MADSGAFGHPPEQAARAAIGQLAFGPADKGVVDVMAGDRRGDGVEMSDGTVHGERPFAKADGSPTRTAPAALCHRKAPRGKRVFGQAAARPIGGMPNASAQARQSINSSPKSSTKAAPWLIATELSSRVEWIRSTPTPKTAAAGTQAKTR